MFDLVPEVADRYLSGSRQCKPMEIWKHNRQVSAVRQGFVLRIQAGAPFLLHWTRDDWGTVEDSRSTPTPLGIEYFDIVHPASTGRTDPLHVFLDGRGDLGREGFRGGRPWVVSS